MSSVTVRRTEHGQTDLLDDPLRSTATSRDEDGKFDWAEADEEVHTFINDLGRPVGTYRTRRQSAP
jgi:hypothetical protein